MSDIPTGLDMKRRARIDAEIAIMTTYRSAFEAKRKVRHAIEDRESGRATLEVWEQPSSLDRSSPGA